MENQSVHCIITSPPYWNLRKYKGPTPTWAGSVQCRLGEEYCLALYIEHLSAVFCELKRVLRNDGVFFFNIGETCVKGYPANVPERCMEALGDVGFMIKQKLIWAKGINGRVNDTLDLDDENWIGGVMPEPVDGWRWIRHKVRSKTVEAEVYEANLQNEMFRTGRDRNSASASIKHIRPPLMVNCPSCDKCSPHNGYVLKRGSWRPTYAHEFVFMVVKSHTYYCDRDAVAMPHRFGLVGGASIGKQLQDGAPDSARRMKPEDRAHKGGRNFRSVMAVQTKPYKGAHFATYPEALVRPMILAACPRWTCGSCGAAHARVETSDEYWPTCGCPPTVSAAGVVLDPFLGSGTTLVMAALLGVNGVGIEACEEYAEQAACRLNQVPNIRLFVYNGSTQKAVTPDGSTQTKCSSGVNKITSSQSRQSE